jgi:biopolymer transport protein ExbB/TolQ
MNLAEFLSFLWHDNSVAGRVLTLFILVLGISATATSLWHIWRYRALEMGELGRVAKLLKDARDAQAPAERHDAPLSLDLEKTFGTLSRHTLIGDRLVTLNILKGARVKADVEALQQMTVLRESASMGLAFPGYAVDMAMMIGLLGTFIGLCLMLFEMKSVGAADATAVTTLGEIIASKQTAFATTLVGLACAIALSGLNFLLARSQAAFYNQLERFTSGDLLPAIVPAVANETVLERLSLQLTESFSQLTTLVDNHAEQAQQLAAVERGFETIVADLRAIMIRAGEAPTEEAAGALTGLVKQLSDTNRNLGQIAGSMHRGGGVPSWHSADSRAAVIGPNTAGLLRRVEAGLGLMRDNTGFMLAALGVAGVLLILVW